MTKCTTSERIVTMFRRAVLLSSGMLGLGITIALAPCARAEPPPRGASPQEPAAPQEGVEFLARGPVHEAFAQPALRQTRPSPVIPKDAPKSIEELPPDQKPEGGDVQWIPGYWAWDDDANDFLWVSGIYRTVPPGRHWVPGYWNATEGGSQRVVGLWAERDRNDVELLPAPPDPVEEAVPPSPSAASVFQPGCWVYRETRYLWRPGFWNPYRADWVWTPARYTWTPGGCVFVDGYWDHPLRDRGLLFAPVNIERRFRDRPGWSYQPSYVVSESFLLSALFVRPGYGQYCFGDYFAPRYDRLGFVAWPDFRHGRTIVDPLFTHYEHDFRDNPGWARDLRQLYVARRDDPAARPPRTLVQQNTVIQSITNNTTNISNVTKINNMTALTPLSGVENRFVRLRPVTGAQRVEVRRGASQFTDFGAQRRNLETQAGKSTQAPARPGEPPRPVRVELPKARPALVQAPDGARPKPPPARPVMPHLEPKPLVRPGPGDHLDAHPKSGPQDPRPVARPAPGKPPGNKAEPPGKSEPKPAPKPPG
jgi:hypothetical protein